MSKKVLYSVVIAVLIGCGGAILWYTHSKDRGDYYEGVVTYRNCLFAGTGCRDYTMIVGNDELPLVGSTDATLKQYRGKNVKIKGSIIENVPSGTGESLRVDAISLR